MSSSPGLNKASSIVSRLHSAKLYFVTIPEHDVWQGS